MSRIATCYFLFFSSRRRHTRLQGDWSSDVCSSDLVATLYIATAIRTEAGLSFLGLGIPPPTPSWGNILSEGRQYIKCCPWITTFSGLAIMLAVLAFNLMGDALRDLLDPRLRGE